MLGGPALLYHVFGCRGRRRICRSSYVMTRVELPTIPGRFMEDPPAPDRSVVHAKNFEHPAWTLCGRINDEPDCCRRPSIPTDDPVCTRCNRQICPSCLDVARAWRSLGRTPGGLPFGQPS